MKYPTIQCDTKRFRRCIETATEFFASEEPDKDGHILVARCRDHAGVPEASANLKKISYEEFLVWQVMES